jgi:hypothetical protein
MFQPQPEWLWCLWCSGVCGVCGWPTIFHVSTHFWLCHASEIPRHIHLAVVYRTHLFSHFIIFLCFSFLSLPSSLLFEIHMFVRSMETWNEKCRLSCFTVVTSIVFPLFVFDFQFVSALWPEWWTASVEYVGNSRFYFTDRAWFCPNMF